MVTVADVILSLSRNNESASMEAVDAIVRALENNEMCLSRAFIDLKEQNCYGKNVYRLGDGSSVALSKDTNLKLAECVELGLMTPADVANMCESRSNFLQRVSELMKEPSWQQRTS